MTFSIEKENNKFRVVTQEFRTKWLPETAANRKVMVIMLRCLEDESGEARYTYQELAKILGSADRQAASNYVEEFRESGEDFLAVLERKRKVNHEVVTAVLEILKEKPLAKVCEIAEEVNRKLGRNDISSANVDAALEQISCREIRKIIQEQVSAGEVNYAKEFVIEKLFTMLMEEKPEAAKSLVEEIHEALAPIASAVIKDVPLEQSLPAEMSKLIEPKSFKQEELAKIWSSAIGWKLWALILYVNGVSLASIGGWLGVNKSTVCRWLTQISDYAGDWLKEQKVNFSGKVAIDEKWFLLDGVWWYLFVAVDCATGYPIHLTFYPNNDGNYCKLFLLQLRKLGYFPKIIITDGWDAYLNPIKEIFPDAKHLLCRFHAIRSLFRRLRNAFVFSSSIFIKAGKLFKTSHKRTVTRRMTKLQSLLDTLGKGQVMASLWRKIPQLLPPVGSSKFPSTANAAENFFSALQRFCATKGAFCDLDSAQKHVNLFTLFYIFKISSRGLPCPLEKTGCSVANIPFYHLLNSPNSVALKERMALRYLTAA